MSDHLYGNRAHEAAYLADGDALAELLERRVCALEEIMAARWPRRWLLSARLRKQLREAVSGYGWAGEDFWSRRAQQVSDTYWQE